MVQILGTGIAKIWASNVIMEHNSHQMSYFDNLIKARNLTECPLPLWRLKVTDKEYETLKCLLQQHARMYRSFDNVKKEATLFFAEYWRREYNEGKHSKEMVFSAISQNSDKQVLDNFYDAAKDGAEALHIEKYSGEREQNLNSMLYQGGLPMKLVTTTDVNSVWGRFVRGLVFRNINFDELALGKVALSNKGLRQYCEQLCDAVDSKDFTKMPCWCETEQNAWYQFLLNKFTSVRRTHRLANPFTLDWEFAFDKVDNRIHIKYDFRGLQTLPKEFCYENHLRIEKFLTLNITRNGLSVDSFDYLDGFCRREVRSKHSYNNGDIIAAYLQGIDAPLIKESFDLATPHLLAYGNNGKYKPCNRIGRDECVIMVPEGWEILSADEGLQITEMRWTDMPFQCIWLPENFNSEVILSSEDGKLTFGADINFSWTEVTSLPLACPNVIEPLYDASRISCVMYTQDEDVPVRKMTHGIEFRNKWSDTWTNTPSYGEIFVRAKSRDGEYVAHEKIINIGESLTIQTVEADRTHCKIKIDWPYGHVSGPESAVVDGSEWIIERDAESGVDRNHIEFTFVPFHNDRSSFTLHVRAPFKDFFIADEDGNKLNDGCTIPYSDVDRCNYYIAGMDVKKLKIGDAECRLVWIEEQLYIKSDERESIPIPFEGPLTRILGSREDLSAMLERTSNDMLHATIPVSFNLSNGRVFSFTIKEAPYLVRQDKDALYIVENERIQIRYNHALKLLKLDDPIVDPVIIRPNEYGFFTIPKEIKDWGNTLVIGRDSGRICPALVNTESVLRPEDRRINRSETIVRIHEELKTATIGSPVWERVSGWFDRCNSEDIPASSLLDLACLKDNPEYLLKFALVMFAQTAEEDRVNLDNRLLEMSKDLAFQWYWLLPRINNGLLTNIDSFITKSDWKSKVIRNLFVSRIYKMDSANFMAHLSNMAVGNDKFATALCHHCLIPLMGEFHAWILKLCAKSMRRSYNNTTIDVNSDAIITDIVNNNKLTEVNARDLEGHMISVNQDLDEFTNSFFAKFSVPSNKPANEIWLLQRVKCVAEQIRGNMDPDLFSQTDSIRRSVIFCYRSTTRHFLLELNNELAKK